MIPTRYIAALLLLVSCSTSGEQAEVANPNVAAKAYNQELLWEEISAIVPDLSTPEDSALLAERYINDWLKEHVLLHQAEAALPESEKQFADELERYRRTLLTYAYENSFVQQRLDTTISTAEIESFYAENQEIFTLKDYIVKVKFCIVDKQTKLKKFRKLFESNAASDLVALEQFCVDNGAAYYVNVDEWMYVEELLTKFPLELYDIEGFLRHTRKAEFEKGDKIYFIRVLDVQYKDNISPLDLVRNQVRDLILNRRKRELLMKMREDLFRSAMANKNIEKLYE